MSRLLAAAERYASLGWPVFPLHSVVDGLCTCGRATNCKSPGKHPRTARGLYDASTDPGQIKQWWTRWPLSNIGIPTGKESGFIGVDVDLKYGGDESIDDLIVEHGPLPATRQQITGGGGRHILFKHPGFKVQNMNGGSGLARGIDLKGDGGYLVMAPSVHVSGREYQWDGLEDSGLADAPEWLLARIRQPQEKPEPAPAGKISEGERHRALVSYAGKLRRSGCNADEILAALLEFNRRKCNPPKSDSEVRKIAEDIGKRYEAAQGSGGPRILAGHDCAALMREELKPMEWLIDDLLPKGLYLLADREKGGKSYLAMQIGLAVAMGRPVFPNSERFAAKKRGKVHYFDLEMDKKTFQERLHFLDAEALQPGCLSRITELSRLTETGVPELRELLDREPAGLVVIDTLASATRGGGAKNQDVFKSEYQELSLLRDLAHERDITVLILHHTNKALAAESVFDAISGTRARGAATDGNFVVVRKGGVVTLHGVGRRLSSVEIAISLWHQGVPGWSLLGDPEKVRRSRERNAVLRLLGEGGRMHPKNISEALGKPRSSIRRLLFDMFRDGEVHRHGDGEYSAVMTPEEADQ